MQFFRKPDLSVFQTTTFLHLNLVIYQILVIIMINTQSDQQTNKTVTSLDNEYYANRLIGKQK